MTLAETISSFINDARYRVAVIGNELDKSKQSLNSRRNRDLERMQTGLISFLDCLYVERFSFYDNLYNFLDWSEDAIIKETEYLRYFCEVQTAPQTPVVPFSPFLFAPPAIIGGGGDLPSGAAPARTYFGGPLSGADAAPSYHPLDEIVRLTDGAVVDWTISALRSQAQLDTARTSLTLNLRGFKPGAHCSLLFKKQSASDLTIIFKLDGGTSIKFVLPEFSSDLSAGLVLSSAGANTFFLLNFENQTSAPFNCIVVTKPAVV